MLKFSGRNNRHLAGHAVDTTQTSLVNVHDNNFLEKHSKLMQQDIQRKEVVPHLL